MREYGIGDFGFNVDVAVCGVMKYGSDNNIP
jgi:hypothetical protein